MEMNARELAVDILSRVLYQGAYSNLALDQGFKSQPLKEEDRGLVTEIVYGTLKHLLTLDELLKRHMSLPLEKVERQILLILRISIYQMKYLDRIPPYAVINEAVNMTKKKSKKASGFVNGVLRGFVRKGEAPHSFENEMEEAVFTHSFPQWLITLFQKQYPENYQLILEGLNERPAMTFRVNTLKSTREEALTRLLALGYEATATDLSPYGIEIIGGRGVLSNPLFQEGILTVQDESSMLVAPLLVDTSGPYLDLCAAPGGKATHLVELTKGLQPVYAFDLYESKLKLIRQTKERLGLAPLQVEKNDARVFMPSFKEGAQVLLDAPCSGLGIIRKKPEIKYTKNQEELASLVALQRELLTVAKDYIPKGGTLLYSTCTLNRSENEENLRWFLKNEKDFEVVPITLGQGSNLQYTEEGFVTILPGKTMDGFFIGKLRRKLGES